MSQAKKCPTCGAVVDLNAKICPQCNHFFRTTFDPSNPQASNRPLPMPLDTSVGQVAPKTGVVYVERLQRVHNRRSHPIQWGFILRRVLMCIVAAVAAWYAWNAYRNGTITRVEDKVPAISHPKSWDEINGIRHDKNGIEYVPSTKS